MWTQHGVAPQSQENHRTFDEKCHFSQFSRSICFFEVGTVDLTKIVLLENIFFSVFGRFSINFSKKRKNEDFMKPPNTAHTPTHILHQTLSLASSRRQGDRRRRGRRITCDRTRKSCSQSEKDDGMPRYYCDYCGTYLTHDSAPGRRQHNRGKRPPPHLREALTYLPVGVRE